MAIYHFDASVISRSKGRSATAASAYRAAERIVDRRTGEVHDYTRKHGVEHTEILAPAHAPDWARDRSALWNAVEQIERRKDAQVSREVRVALPSELTPEQNRDLVRGLKAHAEIGGFARWGVQVMRIAARIGRESAKQTKNGKAAFTLRLDGERHLKLRLASALGGRSAQVLVTEAVDALLETMPEVATLVAQLPEPKRRR